MKPRHNNPRQFYFEHFDNVRPIYDPEKFIAQNEFKENRQLIVNQCIACYSDFNPSYIPYIMNRIEIHGVPRVVLMNHRLLGGLGFPGGKIEKEDTSYFNAALREFHEETSVNMADFIANGYTESVEKDACFFYDSRTHCISGMHMIKIKPENMCLLIHKISQAMMEDAKSMYTDISQNSYRNSADLLMQEVCGIVPVVLTKNTIRTTIQRSAAYDLVAQQLNYVLAYAPE